MAGALSSIEKLNPRIVNDATSEWKQMQQRVEELIKRVDYITKQNADQQNTINKQQQEIEQLKKQDINQQQQLDGLKKELTEARKILTNVVEAQKKAQEYVSKY